MRSFAVLFVVLLAVNNSAWARRAAGGGGIRQVVSGFGNRVLRRHQGGQAFEDRQNEITRRPSEPGRTAVDPSYSDNSSTNVTQATPTSSTTTVPNPENLVLSDMERDIIHYTNLERQKFGLTPLIVDSGLLAFSRRHSERMARWNKHEHREDEFNVAENIAGGYTGAREVVQGWMNSRGHREAILNGSYTRMGAGFANNPSTQLGRFYTQNFLGPSGTAPTPPDVERPLMGSSGGSDRVVRVLRRRR